MKNYETMTAADLRVIAREYDMPGAWKATKPQMIAWLTENVHETEEPEIEVIEETEEETDVIEEIEEIEDEISKEDEDETEEEETEEPEHKEVKRPSKRINEIEFNGKTQSLRAWAEELGMPWPTLYDRINRNGWTIEEALTIPLGARRQKRA